MNYCLVCRLYPSTVQNPIPSVPTCNRVGITHQVFYSFLPSLLVWYMYTDVLSLLPTRSVPPLPACCMQCRLCIPPFSTHSYIHSVYASPSMVLYSLTLSFPFLPVQSHPAYSASPHIRYTGLPTHYTKMFHPPTQMFPTGRAYIPSALA